MKISTKAKSSPPKRSLAACTLLLVVALFSLSASFGTGQDAHYVPAPGLAKLDSTLPVHHNAAAYCITGHMRGFGFPEVVRSLKNHVIDIFSPPSDSTLIVDAFVILAVDNKTSRAVEQLRSALNYLKVSAYAAQDISNRVPANNCTAYPNTQPPSVPGSRAVGFYNQFLKVQDCYAQVKARELAQGWRYDWLVRVRPDILWKDDYPVTVHNASRTKVSLRKYPESLSCVSDHWAIVPHQLAPFYFEAANVLYNCTTFEEYAKWCSRTSQTRIPEDPFYAECYLTKWLGDHNVILDEYENTFQLIAGTGEVRWGTDEWMAWFKRLNGRSNPDN
ncbi:hypothetical protein HDU88_002316 [Geranomyces variabilis]|nr:hypothetical protein HDU88_002316 [Geranomyces variabilis]